jgi:hypothetical protein
MTNPIRAKAWSPYAAGLGIGLLSWVAFATADKPLGVSTPFEQAAALTEKAVVPAVEETNAYFAAKAEEGKPAKVGWEWMVVVGVFVGAVLSSRLSGDRSTGTVPDLWRQRFGPSVPKRIAAAFVAGAVMMFGARLAQGCTSGHGISGSLQLAASSWVFSATFFIVATATALLIYGRKEVAHV